MRSKDEGSSSAPGQPNRNNGDAPEVLPEMADLTLPERLRFHRRHRNLTLRQVSIASNVTESHLSQIERGVVRDPRLGTLVRIAKALEVPVESLVKDLPEDPSG